MILTAHPPGFLPDFYFFYKIAHSEVFLLADHLKFRKQSPLVRTRLSDSDPVRYLTVPVRHHRQPHPPLREVQLEDTTPWRRQHLRTLRSLFGKFPYFEYYFPLIEEAYGKNRRFLVDFLRDHLAWQFRLLFPNHPVRVASEEGIHSETDLPRWLESLPEPIFRIYPEEAGYYENHYPTWPRQLLSLPEPLSFPTGYAPEHSLIVLFFLKGPETSRYLSR
jgi:hypothetical protein